MMDDWREFVTAAINDGIIEKDTELAALVMFAGFEYGPKAGVIARELKADLSAVGQMVENLDAGGFWEPYAAGMRHRGILAEWPLLFCEEVNNEQFNQLCTAFVLDVLVAQGLLVRKRDADGQFIYQKSVMSEPPRSKECVTCKQTKPLEMFTKYQRGGYFPRCKHCHINHGKRFQRSTRQRGTQRS